MSLCQKLFWCFGVDEQKKNILKDKSQDCVASEGKLSIVYEYTGIANKSVI